MFALPLILPWSACAPPAEPAPPPETLSRGIPQQWIWISSSDGRFEVAFPGIPSMAEVPETVKLPDGTERTFLSRRLQSLSQHAGFGLFYTPEPPGAVEALGGPAAVSLQVADDLAASLGGSLDGIGPWSDVAGGIVAVVANPLGGASQVRAGFRGDDLFVLHAKTDPPAAALAFVGSFRLLTDPAPVRVTLGPVEVVCPSRCGPASDKAPVGSGLVDRLGLKGVLDRARFEGFHAPLPEGVDAAAAVESVVASHTRKAGVTVTRDEPADGGRRVRWTTGRTVAELWVGVVAGELVVLEVSSPLGELPAWSDRFLVPLPPG